MVAILGVFFVGGVLVFAVLAGLTALFTRARGIVLGGEPKVAVAVLAILACFLSAAATVWMVSDLGRADSSDSVMVNFMGEDVAEAIFGGGLPGNDFFTD